MKKINETRLSDFSKWLKSLERAEATVKKYVGDVRVFLIGLGDEPLTKERVIAYKEELAKIKKPSGVNVALAALNAYFIHIGRAELKMTSLKVQRKIFCRGERELNLAEYEKLLNAAKEKKNKRLYYLMQTVCATGIRVSELKFIDVEAVTNGAAEVRLKGKSRTVLLPKKLCRGLKKYIKHEGISSGSVFVTRSGKPLDRSNIWKMMRALCAEANVAKSKVFPHNMRHLFARTFYDKQKDIVRLADILGHSSVNTTRIYTIESGEVHRTRIESLGLLRC